MEVSSAMTLSMAIRKLKLFIARKIIRDILFRTVIRNIIHRGFIRRIYRIVMRYWNRPGYLLAWWIKAKREDIEYHLKQRRVLKNRKKHRGM